MPFGRGLWRANFRVNMTYDKDKLRAHQLECVALLAKAHRFLEAEGIAYVIEAGTLLGAVRHGGFIPWDDDLDMLVLEENFHKLKRLSEDSERTMERYGVRVGLSATDPYYVCIRGSVADTIVYIDVYPLQRYTRKRPVLFLKKINSIMVTLSLYLNFSGVFPDMKTYPRSWFPFFQKDKRDGLRVWVRFFLRFRLFWRFWIPIWAWFARKTQWFFLDSKGEWLTYHFDSRISSGTPLNHLCVKHSDVFPRGMIDFEGVSVYAPRERHIFLESYFGSNYMTLPPESSRNPQHFDGRFKKQSE